MLAIACYGNFESGLNIELFDLRSPFKISNHTVVFSDALELQVGRVILSKACLCRWTERRCTISWYIVLQTSMGGSTIERLHSCGIS